MFAYMLRHVCSESTEITLKNSLLNNLKLTKNFPCLYGIVYSRAQISWDDF